jgi:5-methylcytosine-specific restriction endonuclease McrA
MWYNHVGPHCAYCGVEMVDHLHAFEVNDRNTKENRRIFSRNERRLADNHPTIEHLVPKSRGGSSMYKNLVVACRICNNLRGDAAPRPVRKGILTAWYKVVDNHLVLLGESPYPNPKIEGINQ